MTDRHRHFVDNVVDRLLTLVCAVHDDGPRAVQAALTSARSLVPPHGVEVDDALMVTLAAMVNPNASRQELITWTRRREGDPALLFPERPKRWRRNPLAVEMAVRGSIPACALNPAEAAEAVLLLRHRMTVEQMADHLRAEPHQVREWAAFRHDDQSAA